MVDAYGFRGTDERLAHLSFAHLSPFEFFMYWGAEALLPPSDPRSGGRSEWTDEGKKIYEAMRQPGVLRRPHRA